ncbi:hypothetical protein O181_058843 [Austropuccinia psidii MF-1]|uniref:Reverse transcriptase Ty1/copia-type domain-containing protein n=1 Tax=Austropuccinia psidii MF-1 TaxID=1389203 RepID=A0A9Q3HVZ2_9BASI|nr:hypothetical protein [Austropuccinia psidii MF-1]
MIPNLHTGTKVPREILFGIKPNLDWLRTFGELAFVHIPHEKRQKLSDRAIKANIVMHLPDSKGWVFYNAAAGKLISSAWATFPTSAAITKYLTCQPKEVARKNNIDFLLNSLTLARYVARGNSQLSGQDFHETFTPTVTFTSLRILLTIAAQSEMHVASFDFVVAYLNASIEEEICIRPPEGLEIPAGSGCRLRKALYGTCQAGRCWWTHLCTSLEKRGFHMSNYNSSVYWDNDHGMIIWLHVNDGIVFSKNKADLDNIKQSLCFEINQLHLICSIVSRYWDNHSSAAAPLPSKLNLWRLTENNPIIRQSNFLSCVGALSYVATGTRPDISFAVNLLARHSKHPGKEQWSCLQHLLGYLKRTSSQVLCIKPRRPELDLEVYSDASWGGEFSRSTHGYLTRLSNYSISWCSKRLVTVASSSCHAEFMALGIAARHSQWVQNLISEILGRRLTIGMKCDNASCMKITMDFSSNKRTRHLDQELFIRNQLLHAGLATLEWICSTEMLADIFTKPLGPQLH